MILSKTLITLLAAVAFAASAHAESNTVSGSSAPKAQKHAWLVTLNTSSNYAVMWKRNLSPSASRRIGVSFCGSYSASTDDRLTDYADTSRTDREENQNSDSNNLPIRLVLERQTYIGDSTEFRPYRFMGISTGINWSSSHRSSASTVSDSKSFGVDAGPHIGFGVEWNWTPRVSLFLESQAFARFSWSWNRSDNEYTGSSNYNSHNESDDWSVTGGLGTTVLGAAYYF